MSAIALADPGDGRDEGRNRCAVPLVLLAGWAGLFAYSATYLTEDMPFRSAQAGSVQGVEAAVRSDDGPRRILVIAEPETAPPAIPSPPASVRAEPTRPTVVAAAVRSIPDAPARPSPAPVSAEYVGLWGPTPAACGAPSRRRGFIPAMITPERAKAGRTTCSFHDGRRAGAAWVMGAECSDRGRRWSSQVRLVVDGDRLTWSSSRGTSAYVRCTRRAG